MKLTKKKAIELSIEKWTDHAKTGEENNNEDWHERHGYEKMESDCALCEYTDRIRYSNLCSSCPYYQRFGLCLRGVYISWLDAETPEDRKEYANLFLEELKSLG